jgi:hypothetical protein
MMMMTTAAMNSKMINQMKPREAQHFICHSQVSGACVTGRRRFQIKGNFPVCKYLTSGGTTRVAIKVGLNVAAVVFELAKIGDGHQGPHPFMQELHNNWDPDWMKLFKRELEKMLSDGNNLWCKRKWLLTQRKEVTKNPREGNGY